MARVFHLILIVLAFHACRSTKEQSPIQHIDPPAAAGALAAHLHASGTGVIATWLEPIGPSHRLRFARWDGARWSEPSTIVEGAQLIANWADVPSAVVAKNGSILAHWLEASGGEGHAYDAIVGRSTDGGAHWTRLGSLHADRTAAEHGFVSMVPEGDGIRAVWLDGRDRTGGNPGGATALRSVLISTTIGTEEVVDERVCDCCSTSAAVGARGPIVVYRDRSSDEVRDIGVAIRGAAGWQPQPGVQRDGWRIEGCPVNGPAVAASGEHVVVAWFSYAGSVARVRAAFSEDGGSTFGTPIEVDGPEGARAPLGRVAISLDDDGTGIVVWIASRREDAAILARRVAANAPAGSELTIATTRAGRESGFPAVARSGGDLLVTWTEAGEPSQLRTVKLLASMLARAPGSAGMGPVRPAQIAGVGDRAPALEAVTLAGEPTALAALHGQVVLVNLWATWCEPCRQELPILAFLHDQLAPRGLTVVGISVDRERRADEIAELATRRKLPYAIWHDPRDRASAALGVEALPTTILVDRQGVIRWRNDGAIRADDRTLLEAIDRALASTP